MHQPENPARRTLAGADRRRLRRARPGLAARRRARRGQRHGGNAPQGLRWRQDRCADRRRRLRRRGPRPAPERARRPPGTVAGSRPGLSGLGLPQDHRQQRQRRRRPSSDWGYQSQPGAIGHPIHAIRGKVLGGSSAINGAVAIRARREDFARWNLPGWSYDDLLPAFHRLETRQGGDPALHGGDGPLPVRQLSRADLSPMQRAFVDATLANGFKAIADFRRRRRQRRRAVPDECRQRCARQHRHGLPRQRRARSRQPVDPRRRAGRPGALRRQARGGRAPGLRRGNPRRRSDLSAGAYGSPAILLRLVSARPTS